LIGNHDPSTVIGEGVRDRAADTAAAANNERDFAGEVKQPAE
jgi:hypothetical protein